MKFCEGFHEVGDALRGGVVAIGNFDGLHRGHQALFQKALSVANGRQSSAGVLTFSPHPSKVLAPHLAPPMILTPDEKRAGIARAQIDVCVFEPFDANFARMTPEAFAEDILVKGLQVSGVVVGQDFSFGHKGAGKVKDLRRMLEVHNVSVHVVEPVMESGLVCSSSKIRQFILEGRMESAALLLGRPYRLTGTVRDGDARGRRMGIPTANLETQRELLPRLGVYATWARLQNGQVCASVTNIGLRPTFNGEGTRIEVHLLDYEGDLYGQPVEVEFVTHLREEKRFSGVEELRAQIDADIESAREHLRATPAVSEEPQTT